jgi:hypothetical protein
MPTLALLAQRFDFACFRSEQAGTAYRNTARCYAYGKASRAAVDRAFLTYDRARTNALLANCTLSVAAGVKQCSPRVA